MTLPCRILAAIILAVGDAIYRRAELGRHR